MQSTLSVAKGTFVFKNGPKPSKNTNQTKNVKPSSLLTLAYKSQPWYQAYTKMWAHITTEHERLQMAGYAETIAYLRNFVTSSYKPSNCDDKTMRTAALLTGINQPDHYSFFKTFADELRKDYTTSLVCIVQARDCPNIKSTIETMVFGLMESGSGIAADKHLRRSQMSMAVLKEWYTIRFNDTRPYVTVVIPDFSNFHQGIIQQFILMLCHASGVIPIVLVFGVATDIETLNRTLSLSDINLLNLQVSQSPSSSHSLNKIFEDILLTPNCSIAMSAKVFNQLTDIFLYYDMSIDSFMQSFKYCVLEHYSKGNMYSLCSNEENAKLLVREFNASDLEKIRHLPSFRKYVESLDNPHQIIGILGDDMFLRAVLPSLITEVRAYFSNFYCALRLLLALIADIPNLHLGKNLRDLYGKCVASPIVDTAEFQEAWKLLAFMCKADLLVKFSKVVDTVISYLKKYAINARDYKGWKKMYYQFKELITSIESAGTAETCVGQAKTTNEFTSSTKIASLEELKSCLLQNGKQPKQLNEYTKSVSAALEFLRDHVIAKYLKPHSMSPAMYELFVFSDLSAIRTHIVGSPRAAIYTALNNPQSYLECTCCNLTNTMQMVPTLPDLSIAYKLHLECGPLINLFDWLQAFKFIVTKNKDDADADYVDPQLLARFLQAVNELQFLGFIKPSKRKTDHVQRLTW